MAVVTVSAGYNHVDTQILSRRGVRLANTPAVLTDSVAEVGVALILATLRQTVAKVSAVFTDTFQTIMSRPTK